MSAVVFGSVIDSNLSRNANGGTEQMRTRLLKYVNFNLLSKVIIHFSRFEEQNYVPFVPNIFYAHDLPGDPGSDVLYNGGWGRFNFIVFVSQWQRDKYIQHYDIPYNKCTVIENAVEFNSTIPKKSLKKFIYHTTPHRGLELLFPIFDALTKEFSDISLDVFSSFEVYGWKERDKPYALFFDTLQKHPNITYHGAQTNEMVLTYLDKSDIFLYPCIWQETSCIALIEALKANCICIHPKFGALPETSAGFSLMYDWSDNMNEHVIRAYELTRNLLKERKCSDFGVIPEQYKHTITHFKEKWESILTKVVQ